MDPRIKALKSTTFSGRRLTRRQIATVQETVALLPKNSRAELCKTICEHLNWKTAKGAYRVGACTGMLLQLESLGILKLPPKDENMAQGKDAAPSRTSASDPQPVISATLAELGEIHLEPVDDPKERNLWNSLVDRHHYLGYRRPFGPHLRYFLRDGRGRTLGCILFESCSKTLPCRDEWVGWSPRVRDRNRHLLLRNSRFLVLPWVRVNHLASRALGAALRRLADDWEKRHGDRPVLVETFVDHEKYEASSYRASNWQFIGETAGTKGKSKKGVYVYALARKCRETLRGERKKKKASPPDFRPAGEPDQGFLRFWERIASAAVAVADRHDRAILKRRRTLNSLLVILFVYLIVYSKKSQGYGAMLRDLWEQCRYAGIRLPQPKPAAAASMSKAREKVGSGPFRDIHREILGQAADAPEPLWKGHRVLALAGVKIDVPWTLTAVDGESSGAAARRPQATISTLFCFRHAIPVDFEFSAGAGERFSSPAYLEHAAKGDIIVYDRGYYSFEMLVAHHVRGLHCVFRIPEDADPFFDAFIASGKTDLVLDFAPPERARSALGSTRRARLAKYNAAGNAYCLVTTLLDNRKYGIPELAELYREPWSTNELRTNSGNLIGEFRGQSESGIKQEIFAAFTIAAVEQLFANPCKSETIVRPPQLDEAG